MAKRDSFSGRFGVLVALTGSSVGLGNLWRFPYLVGTNGGAAFIIIYLIFVFLLCMPIVFSEFIVGRRSQTNSFRAYKVLSSNKGWGIAGVIAVLSSLSILAFYSVVGGWTIDYIVKACAFKFTTSDQTALETMFHTSVSNVWEPIIYMALFLIFTCVIVMRGIKGGIEKFSKTMMPILFIMVIVIAVNSLLLPGSQKGVDFLFKPDFSKVTSQTLLNALGQAFFSLSIGCGTIITYASYVSKNENIPVTTSLTALFDTLFASIAGLAIMPAVFAFGISPSEGPGLVFITLPHIFAQMPGGSIIAIIFFFILFIAAITSSISLLEVPVAYFKEEFNMSRKKSVLICMAFLLVVGSLSSLSQGVLSDVKVFGLNFFDLFDFLSANIFMTIGGLLVVLFVGWKLKKGVFVDEITNSGTLKYKKFFLNIVFFIVKYVAPLVIVTVMVSSLLSSCQSNTSDDVIPTEAQKEYYNKVVKELSDDSYFGRSVYRDGDIKAAKYIISELQRIGVEAVPMDNGNEEYPATPEYKSKVYPSGLGRWAEGSIEEIVYLQNFSFPMNTFYGQMSVSLDGKELVPTVDYIVKEFSSGLNGKYSVKYLDNKYITTEGLVKHLDSGRYKNSFVVIDWKEYLDKLEYHPFEVYAPYLGQLKNVAGVILKGEGDLFPFFMARSWYTTNMPVLMVDGDFPTNAKEVEVNIENKFLPERDAHNIIAHIPGKKNPDKYLMFSAHYDHLGLMGRDNLFNGANDDASGIAMLLTLAEKFQKSRPDYSVVFLFCDAEEENLLGSFYYTQNPILPLEDMIAFVELDMIQDNGNTLVTQISDQGTHLLEAFTQVNGELSNPFEKINQEALSDYSDHYPFALKKVPAIYFTVEGDFYKYYHTPRDKYENSSNDNFERFYEMLSRFSLKASSL